MLQKYFVSRSDYEHDLYTLRGRNAELTKELRSIEREKAEVKNQLKSKSLEVSLLTKEVVDMQKRLDKKVEARSLKDYLDPVPEGETPRAQYMSQVSGFFEGGLRDQLNYLHTQFKNQTAMFPLTERETDFFRSCINVVGLLLDWGEACVAEHRSNIAHVNNSGSQSAFDSEANEQEASVKKIKRKLK